jgi:membrane AbrB-like protein
MDLPLLSRVLRWTQTLLIGAMGGTVALVIGAPLPWLLGGMMATAAAILSGLRLENGAPEFPASARAICIPVIGVLIGGAFTPDLLTALPGWWPGLLAVLVFVPLAHAANYVVFHRVGGLERDTAFFAAMPGGLIESMEMAREKGGDLPTVTVLQFSRIAVVVTTVPLVFSAFAGRAVGSAAGETIGISAGMGLLDAIVLIACGAIGFLGARRLRIPAGQVMGPLAMSGLAHVTGLTDAAPPPVFVAGAQLVVGVTLGLRFKGIAPRSLGRFLGLSALSVLAMMAIAFLLALAVAATGVAPVPIMVLAYAPGGLVEMGLIALSLQANPIFVTAHHLVRILVTVSVAVIGWRWLSGETPETDRQG